MTQEISGDGGWAPTWEYCIVVNIIGPYFVLYFVLVLFGVLCGVILKSVLESISSIISAAGLRKNKTKTNTNMAVKAVQFACKLLSVYLRPFCNFDLYVGREAWKLINVGFPHCKTNSELGNQRAKLNALHFAET